MYDIITHVLYNLTNRFPSVMFATVNTGPEQFRLEINRGIGQRVQKYREARKLSQQALGQSLPSTLTRSAVSNLETGRQNFYVHVLYAVAQALKVDIPALLPQNILGATQSDPLETRIRLQLQRQRIPPTAGNQIFKIMRSNKKAKGKRL